MRRHVLARIDATRIEERGGGKGEKFTRGIFENTKRGSIALLYPLALLPQPIHMGVRQYLPVVRSINIIEKYMEGGGTASSVKNEEISMSRARLRVETV